MADSEPGLVALALGNAAYAFSKIQPLLPVYIHMILASIFPIYAAAHASLTRPSTAAKPTKKARKRSKPEAEDQDSDSEDEDEEPENEMEGLSRIHIILLPLFAGTALATLYFLIKWLEDPTILNQALNAYFAIFGLIAVTTLVSDVLDIGHSIIFPRRHALVGTLYHVDARLSKAVPICGSSAASQTLTTPFPGFLARIPLSARAKEWLWADRAMPAKKWTLKLFMRRALVGKLKIGPHTMVGAVTALTTLLYFNLVDKPWYLTNLLGFSFAYGAIQVTSPTTFATGSGLLIGLFFYDIYMVFFTPLMVTVATSLEIPIKLEFPRPGSAATSPTGRKANAMIGLGDIVIPGLMIGLALRFDLYLFYLRRQKRVPVTTVEGGEGEEMVVKAAYYPLAGRWSDAFWTHSLLGKPLWTRASPPLPAQSIPAGKDDDDQEEAPFSFPKIYFNAALIGYLAGMVATICAMHLMNHAQPALLWLVPGVLVSLWSTALVRGEVGLMWHYSEEIVDEEGEKRTPQWIKEDAGVGIKDRERDMVKSKSARPEREVFAFSIEAPRSVEKKKENEEEKNENEEEKNEKEVAEGNGMHGTADGKVEVVSNGTFWAGSTSHSTGRQEVDVEPKGKRIRVR